MSELPQLGELGGPARVRQRMRLAAAIGMLAIAALATGGLASLAAGSPSLPIRTKTKAPVRAWTTPEANRLLDPTTRVEAQVHDAEQSVARARAAIRAAREAETVDPEVLTSLERRLEILGESALESVRRSYGPAPDPVDDRPHVRPLRASAREL